MSAKPIFVTGIDTDAGKTVVSAILVEALKANYWKPVQAGDLDNTDSMKVQRLVSNSQSKFFPEAYRLTQPMSPHAAADIDKVEISLEYIAKLYREIQQHSENLIVEGAGGLMVPLNENELILDLIKTLDIDVVVVLKNYLGSINHSLLTLQMLKKEGVSIKGVIFNGESNPESERYIMQYTGVLCLGRIPVADSINPQSIADLGQNLFL